MTTNNRSKLVWLLIIFLVTSIGVSVFFHDNAVLTIINITVLSFICLLIYVSVRHLAAKEESLEKAINEWKAAMDAFSDAIYLLDLDRKLLRANRAFFLMTGSTPEDSVGRHISDIIHPGYSGPCSLCQAEEAKHDAVFVLEADQADNYSGRATEVSIKMVRDYNGEPTSILVTRHDLTLDRKLQKELRDREDRYRQLVELSQDVIFIQKEGRIVYMNDAGLRRFGAASQQEIISKPMLDFVHPDSRALVKSRMETAFDKLCELPVVEVKYQKLDGGAFFGEATTTLIIHQDKPASHVFVRDITARKNLEDQLRHSQKLEAIGHLAGGIAHDFNNILTVIGGYGSLLEMKMLPDDPNRNMVTQILESTERATNLTRSMLAFSRKQEMRAYNVNLNEIIHNVGKFLIRIIGEDITFTTNLENDPITIFADKGQMEQVLINLATNARDVMANGGTLVIETRTIEIDEQFVKAHGYGVPGKYALMVVSDTGSGMDETTKNSIFEPFFTTKEVGKGTGLGLSIVYGIIKQHNGYVNVYSELGRGTTFKLFFPLSGVQQLQNEGNKALAYPEAGSETILVIEDEEPVRKLVESVLVQFGYDVIIAVDGQDGIDKYMANRDKIKLIFTDLIMPKKSGKELYDAVRAVQPDIKVLFTSGYIADVFEKQTNAEEPFDILMKPIAPLELARRVREILDAQVSCVQATDS